MPFRKLAEPQGNEWSMATKRCKHPEHEPPTMRVLEPGTYEWICPACGAVRTVRVPPRGSSWTGSGLFRRSLLTDDCRHSAQSWIKDRRGMYCEDCEAYVKEVG